MGRARRARRHAPSGGCSTAGPAHGARAQRAARASDAGRGRHPDDGHHVHGVLRRQGDRPRLAVRHHPAGHRRVGVAPGRAGLEAAAPGDQRVHRRPVPRAAHRARRRVPRRPARALGELPPRVRRREPGVRSVGAHLGQRSGARQRRHDVRVGGQPPGAERRQLRAREPRDLETRLRRPVRPAEHLAGRRRTPTS